MKKKIIILLGLISTLLIGCESKSQIKMISQKPEETIVLAVANTDLLEYELNLNDFIDSGMTPVISIEHYKNGEHIETIDTIDYGEIIKEKKKIIASVGLTESKDNIVILSTALNGHSSGSGLLLDDDIITKKFIFTDKNFSKIEANEEYVLAAYLLGEYLESHYPINLPDLESKIESYEEVYVFTFKVTDFKTNPL